MYYPAASGVFHSFYRWNGADISERVGFQNYIELVSSTDFWRSFRVAFLLGAFNFLKMLPALAVAVCIHRCRSERMQYLYRVLFVVPMVIPSLVVLLIWRSFFFEAVSGYLNRFLMATGLFNVLCWLDTTLEWGGIFAPGRMPAWLGHPSLIFCAVVLWGFPWVGSFAILTYLAKLQAINRDVYEAADIDGIGWFNKFTRIELPLIMGSVYVLLVFIIIGTIQDAATIMLLGGMEGGPGGAITVPALFMLRKAFLDMRMGYACAIGVVLMLAVMGLQKLTNIWLLWGEFSRKQRIVYQVLFGVIAALLVVGRYYNPTFKVFFPFVLLLIYLALPQRATLLALCVVGLYEYWGSGIVRAALWLAFFALLPYRQIGRVLLGPSLGPFGTLVEWRENRKSARMVRESTHQGVRSLSLWTKAEAWILRGGKHTLIWLVLLLALLPVYLTVVVSFKTNAQFYVAPTTPTAPYHTENWVNAWESIRHAVSNSLYITMTACVFSTAFALCGAYFFTRLRMPLSGIFWNALLILMMYPAIANMIPLFRLLSTMHLLNTLTALIIVGVASGQVFAIFVLRSFIGDIPQDLFEAAEIDGASHFRQMVSVVLPLSGPILGTVAIMHFVGLWNDFILPLIVIRDAEQLPVMVHLMRMSGEFIKYWGPMMAGFAFASIPVIIIFVLSMKLFVRGMTEGALKA